MPLAITDALGSPDLDGLDPSGSFVGVAASINWAPVSGVPGWTVTDGAFSQSLATSTGGDILDVPVSDFQYHGNVITYQLDSTSQGLLPSSTSFFGGQVLGYDATDQIYLVDQYAGFTPTSTGDINTNTFVANGFTPKHFELIGICESTSSCGTATDIAQQYAADGHVFAFQGVPEPASGSVLACAMGIAYIAARLRRNRRA